MTPSPPQSAGRLVVVSNRLPIALEGQDGEWRVIPGEGGLVAALTPILRARGGVWIGWPGAEDIDDDDLEPLLTEAGAVTGYTVHAVQLTREDIRCYYYGFSNEIVWPLFHDMPTLCNFDPSYWKSYRAVNRKFAEAIAEHAEDNDYVWVQDYQLMAVGRELRERAFTGRAGYFLHIPFPPWDILTKLPWRVDIVRGLLQYDLIGFQTLRDRNNFLECVRHVEPSAHVSRKGHIGTVTLDDRVVRAGYFPISVDYAAIVARQNTPVVQQQVEELRAGVHHRSLILGLDRLDYTKGIPQRLKAFRHALAHHRDLQRRVTYVQIVVPSRRNIPEYEQLKVEIEQLVGEINGRFSGPGWIPIHYQFRHVDPVELFAYYQAATIGLITPFKDGMNLVAKEFCAAHVDDAGVLILSEFAGAAAQLGAGAILVNPYDITGVSDAIYEACRMGVEEQTQRMKRLRATIRRHDLFRWVDSFLRVALGDEIVDFLAVTHGSPPTDAAITVV